MQALITLVSTIVDLYVFALIVFIVVNWLIQFNVINSSNRFVYLVMDFLYRITEPLLRPIRSVLPNLGGIDISPVVLVLLLTFARNLLVELYYGAL
jgi:YggT family protein